MEIENKSCLILGIGGVSVHQIALALKNLGITYGTSGLTAGTSALTTGAIYLQYE